MPAEPIEYSLRLASGKRTREARFVNFGGRKVLALVRDITERRQAEQLLAWQTPVLEEIAEGQSSEAVLAQITARHRGADRGRPLLACCCWRATASGSPARHRSRGVQRR